jgi:hypothetical protein
VEVGGVAIHYHKMSANYKWKCQDGVSSFEDLTNGQKKIVKFVFAQRNENWYMFYLPGMIK